MDDSSGRYSLDSIILHLLILIVGNKARAVLVVDTAESSSSSDGIKDECATHYGAER